MLVEIHIIQNHSPANLNRDDTGSPKECMFGGIKRARISSQCLKRSIRRSTVFREAMDGQVATRTRRLPELVRDRLLAEGLAPELAVVAAKKVSGFGTKDGKERDQLETAQTMFLTEEDIAAVTTVLREAAQGKTAAQLEKVPAKDLQAQAEQKGFRELTVDVALFGRMTTSAAFRDVEASAQVAHALSTHKVDHEFDYFTAVDDLQDLGDAEKEADSGADMLGDVEFNSACFYKYFSVDVKGLRDSLTGKRPFRREPAEGEEQAAHALAARAVSALVAASALTTPSGKQNSFAAHQLPAAILVEVRPHCQPVSYANAFVDPARQGAKDLVTASLEKLGRHVQALTDGFNLQATSRWLFAPEHPDFSIAGVERVKDLNTLRARLEEVALHG